jgi:hypothetical protein
MFQKRRWSYSELPGRTPDEATTTVNSNNTTMDLSTAASPARKGFVREMTKGSEELMSHIRSYLSAHPNAAAELGLARVAEPAPPTAGASAASSPAVSNLPERPIPRTRNARSVCRRSFYGLVVLGLAILALNVVELSTFTRTTYQAQEAVEAEVRQNRGWLGRVLVVQALLITFNIILTYRGVKVRTRAWGKAGTLQGSRGPLLWSPLALGT